METSIGRTLASVMAAEELENKFLRTIKDPINEKGKWQTGCKKITKWNPKFEWDQEQKDRQGEALRRTDGAR